MASTYDYEVSINGIEGESEEEEEDESGTSEPLHHARRPMNAFLIFCKRQRAVVKERFPQLENRAVTKILGEWWANLEECEKSCYTDLAKQYREAFLKANPGFKWYKLPAPPIRPISNRLKLLTSLTSHQGSITPGKLADESQLGGLSSLLVPYNNMSMSPSLAVQSVPKPPKKRYLEENASSDDPSQVFDDVQEKEVAVDTKVIFNSKNTENEPVSDRVLEIEPFAKLRNYSVSAKENMSEVKSEPNSMSVRSNGSLQISAAGNHLVISNNNNSFSNDSQLYSFNRNPSEVKCEEVISKAEGNKFSNNLDPSLCNEGNNCTEIKWKTKFEKIKSRHLNYNNNNIDETTDSLKCSSYECSSNQDPVTNKLANGRLKEVPENCTLNTIKKEEVLVNGETKYSVQSFDKPDNPSRIPNSLAQSALLNVEQMQPIHASSTASKLNNKSDIVFYHTNKLPDLKTANKLLNKSVPIIGNESDANFMRRNKSVRACKGVRYQEFMSSNQLGRKRRRKINASNDSRYEGNEDEDILNRHLLKIGSEEFKSIKDEEKYERMEVESAIYNIHDDLDQNDCSFSEISSASTAMNKSAQSRRVKHIRTNKRRRSLTSLKSNSLECTSDDMDADKKCNSTNFNLEEKIGALPALSLEEFQEKKRARNKKHYCLENNGDHDSILDSHFNGLETQFDLYSESDSSLASKSLTCENISSSTGFDLRDSDDKEFPSKFKETKGENGFVATAESTHKVEIKFENRGDSISNSFNGCSFSTPTNFSPCLNGMGSDQKSSISCGSSNVLVGSRKRKARRQKITHLEPGSKKKDTSVVEVDILNDMGLATLAEVAALSRKESII